MQSELRDSQAPDAASTLDAGGDSSDRLRLRLGFSGGVELLFDNQRSLQLDLPNDGAAWTLRRLIQHLKTEHLKWKQELFVQGDKLRPGIIVVVNDCDWELLGKHEYVINTNDDIMFISTLHGG